MMLLNWFFQLSIFKFQNRTLTRHVFRLKTNSKIKLNYKNEFNESIKAINYHFQFNCILKDLSILNLLNI